MSRISAISAVNSGQFAAEFPRSAPSSSFFSGLRITDSLNH
jgi:hypothetical protein